ncbi:Msd1 protein [Candida orthopsilosis Co 90-125]|uniref:Msd1 protein n=1 Tax=Candida orthopsilosis (strain 90-125) TaxID=1136231 RepID=H8X036_CANO9|nr:Msd1 protein [Candida orthopsilosis Co 90-125]CCG22547.1 Msd1 protein [Candida orthopsilosis Co 90-125]
MCGSVTFLKKKISNPFKLRKIIWNTERLHMLPTLARTSRRYLSRLPDKTSTLAKFNFPLATNTIKSVTENIADFINNKQKITLNGHIHRKARIRPTLGFGFLRDSDGEVIQFIANDATNHKIIDTMKELTVEESVSICGFVQPKQLKEGESKSWELVLEDIQILNSSNIDAPRLEKLKQTRPEDLPPQFRYLQLRTAFYQNALRTRSKISQLIRKVLVDNHDFVEIETPLLFKSTPEGAREFLVPTRSPNQFYALPQSPQQYKQILMSSGFTKYFQIAKCFRDEDLRSDRQPEFTQVDLEMSYVNSSNQVMQVVEDVVLNVWGKVKKTNVYTLNENGELVKVDAGAEGVRLSKLDYLTALREYGIDKPDLRSNISFNSLESFFTSFEDPEFPVVEACVLRGAFDPLSKSSKPPKSLTSELHYSRRRPYVFMIKSKDDVRTWYELLLQKGFMRLNDGVSEERIHEHLNLQPGDILAVSNRSHLPYENPTPLGKFRQLAIAEFPGKWQRPIRSEKDLIDTYNADETIVGSWLVEFPLFNPVEISEDINAPYPKYDKSKLESTHHPFTMCKSEDYNLLETAPLGVRGEHYDLVINGVEVGGGSRRIHDAALQQYIFEEILKVNNYQQLFGHLLKALSMGCPPHAGLALGFDRLCAMVVGTSSIKDVIAFPKNQSGSDRVVESPTAVDEKTLNEYFITTKNS